MPEPFSDNWTYLKVELNWLERLLLLAVTRQKKETKEIDRVAQTRADRATSHWWKGMVSLEGVGVHDSPVERRKAGSAEGAKGTHQQQTYQQQIEARIQATEQQGIVLALPALCDRLKLTPFERSLILMGLAPEVHRRYAQLYEYLQGKEGDRADLPSFDLALRLFCRTDAEWRAARSALTDSSPLIQHQLVELVFNQEAPLLNRLIKLSDPWVNFLLSDRPDLTELDKLLSAEETTPTSPQTIATRNSKLKTQNPKSPYSFSELILPEPLLEMLQHLCHRVQFCRQVDEDWGFENAAPGIVALMVGASGTGKTIAAHTIAQTLNTPLTSIDLAQLNSFDHAELLKDIFTQAPTVLLIKSAEIWLDRRSPLSLAEVHQFLNHRQAARSLTFLSVERPPASQHAWRSQLQPILRFPLPDQDARLRLWKQAFPPQVPLDSDIDWDFLANKSSLTGGEIQAIARSAAFWAIAESPASKLKMRHLLRALTKRMGDR